MYRFDDFLADPKSWRLSRGGQEIHLEPVVLKLLIYLIENRERLVTRQELMDTVWGDTVISESALTKAVARLRRALGDDSATHRYLETVRSRGYRFVANVEEIETPNQPELSPERGRATILRRALLASAMAILALVIVAVFWPRALQHKTPEVEVIRSLAVLPLNNLTGDPEQDYYVDGLQDILITELSQIRGLRVTSRQSTTRYRNSELPTTDIAGELGVDAIVEGSLLREGNRIEVTVQLIDGRSDKHLWAERYTRETPHVFNLISEVANAIDAEITTKVPQEGDRLTPDRMGPVDSRAIDAYALGIAHLDRFTRDGIRTAINQFQTAVAIEPKFALAWGQLAVTHAMHSLFGFAEPSESIQQWQAAALKAIEADDQVAIGHSALGWARMWTGDFDGACESFAEALRLDPSAPYAMHGDADCLMLDGHMDESVARIREILFVSPFSAMHNLPLCSHLYMARRFEEAITAAKDVQARNRQLSIHWFLAMVYWQQGRFDKALEEERLELEQRGDTVLLAALDEGFDAAGPTGAMRSMAEALVDRAHESYVNPFFIGEAFARAEMVDEALHWLDQAVGHGSYNMTYLAFWPPFDVLRDDPRYQDLVERVYGSRAQEISRAAISGR
jgi:TolB-like protein/DNA-binding winged helix-turn-helix (wHTH) protein/tetratricopeptide (TPR) repeat protein